MKVKRLLYVSLGLMVLCAIGFNVWRYCARPMAVPEFPKNVAEGVPAAVLELEPDFGWRTGDIIPLRVYIHERAGVVCDTKSLMLNGDTRLHDAVAKRQLMPDGSSVLRLDVQVQGFIWTEKAKASLKIEYRVEGSRERKLLTLPDLEYSVSRTYDGDKTSKHPKDRPAVFVTSYGWGFTLLLATIATATGAISLWYLWVRPVYKRKKNAPLVPESDAWKAAIKQVRSIVDKLKAGGDQVPLLTGLDGLMRRLYNMDAVTVSDLQALSDKEHPELMSFTLLSQYCQQAIYSGKLLELAEIGNLAELVEEALAALPRINPKSLGQLGGSTC